MKKISLTVLLAAVLLLVTMTGCSFNKTINAPVSVGNSSAATSNQGNGTTSDQGNSTTSEITATSGPQSSENEISITLPASMFEDMTQEEIEAGVDENGYTSCTINEDGSVTYVMTKKVHEELLKSYRQSIDESIGNMIDGEAQVEAFTRITYNDDMSEFYVYVDPTVYTEWDSLNALSFYISGAYYQSFQGVAADDIDVLVSFIDQDTESVLNTGSYRDMVDSAAADEAEPTDDTAQEETSGQTDESDATLPDQEAGITETLLCDTDGIKVTAKSLTFDGWSGPTINVEIENTSTKNVTVQANAVSVNGYMTDVTFSCDVAAGKKAVDTITLSQTSLEQSGIELIGEIELQIRVFDSDSWETVFDTEMITLLTTADGIVTQGKKDDGDVVYEADGIRIVALGVNYDGWMGPELYFYIENATEESITVQANDVSMNGYMVSTVISSEVGAGKMMVDDMIVYSSDMEAAGVETIKDMEFVFHIFDTDSWDTIVDTDVIRLEF